MTFLETLQRLKAQARDESNPGDWHPRACILEELERTPIDVLARHFGSVLPLVLLFVDTFEDELFFKTRGLALFSKLILNADASVLSDHRALVLDRLLREYYSQEASIQRLVQPMLLEMFVISSSHSQRLCDVEFLRFVDRFMHDLRYNALVSTDAKDKMEVASVFLQNFPRVLALLGHGFYAHAKETFPALFHLMMAPDEETHLLALHCIEAVIVVGSSRIDVHAGKLLEALCSAAIGRHVPQHDSQSLDKVAAVVKLLCLNSQRAMALFDSIRSSSLLCELNKRVDIKTPANPTIEISLLCRRTVV